MMPGSRAPWVRTNEDLGVLHPAWGSFRVEGHPGLEYS